jgi:hypothetical protein
MEATRPRSALLGAGIFAMILVASCARSSSARIVTADDLEDAIRDTGAVALTLGDMAGDGFGVSGRRIGVGQAEIAVFEYVSADTREAVSSTIPPDASAVGGESRVWDDRPHIWATGRLIVVYVGTDGGTVLLLEGLLGDPITEEAQAGEAPYPPAVTAAIRSLAQELGLDPGAIQVMDYEEVDWPDTCLGLPEPGEACGEAITAGWRVTLQAGGETYELRTDLIGSEVRGP